MKNISIALFIAGMDSPNAPFMLGDNFIDVRRAKQFRGTATFGENEPEDGRVHITYGKPGRMNYVIIAGGTETLRRMFKSGLAEIERLEKEASE